MKNELISSMKKDDDKNDSIIWPTEEELRSLLSQVVDVLVVGDSMVRDIEENALVNVKCVPGAPVTAVVEQPKQVKTKYREIYLMVGSDDCSEETSVEEVLSNYEELINVAKHVGEAVRVSGLCPRTDNIDYLGTVLEVNEGLKSLSDTCQVTFIDTIPSFTLQDGQISDGYLASDGIHLQKKGTEKLLQNWGLSKLTKYKYTKPNDKTLKRTKPTENPQEKTKRAMKSQERNIATRKSGVESFKPPNANNAPSSTRSSVEDRNIGRDHLQGGNSDWPPLPRSSPYQTDRSTSPPVSRDQQRNANTNIL